MKLLSVLLLSLMGVAATLLAQPVTIMICESTELLNCPCGIENPLPDGSTAYLFHDANNNGVDPSDLSVAVVPWCPESSPEFCCFEYTDDFQPPGTYRYYVRVASVGCCWTSAVFIVVGTPQDVELEGWTCEDEPCPGLQLPPDPPFGIQSTPCLGGQLYLLWGHSGENLDGFNIYRDDLLLVSLPPGQREVMLDCTPGWATWSVSAFNAAGESPRDYFWQPQYLLRFVDGSDGDVSGTLALGSEISLWFQSGVDWETFSTQAELVLLSGGVAVDTLCGATNVNQLTCPLPTTPYANCRIMLIAHCPDYPGIVDHDTTSSTFDIIPQWSSTLICEPNQILVCPCNGGSPLPSGSVATLFADINRNGVDGADTAVIAWPWCEPVEYPCCVEYPWALGYPDTHPYYVRVSTAECCWTSWPFTMWQGQREVQFTGWGCAPVDCNAPPQPPAAPGWVRVSPCSDVIHVRWDHDNVSLSGFWLYEDTTRVTLLPANRRAAILVCHPGVNQICVSAFNDVGESPRVCATPPPFLLRFVDGSLGDLSGDLEGGSEVTLWFQYGTTDPAGTLAWITLILLADDLPVDTLCVAANVDHLRCALPLTPRSNCRVLLQAESLDFPGLVEYDTTNSTFDIVVNAPPLPAWSTLHFAYTLEQLGCPCSYPLQPPPGTMLRLKHREHPTDPTRNPVIAEMPISTGSGLPPWNGYWTPRPDSILRMGDFYLEIQTDACCWVGRIDDAITTDTMQVPLSGWSCGEACTVPTPQPSHPDTTHEPSRIEPPPAARLTLAISPNPFNATTTISFVLTEQGTVRLALYDMLGRVVATLANGVYESGAHRVTFDGTDLATGLYFVRLESGANIQTRKLLLLK